MAKKEMQPPIDPTLAQSQRDIAQAEKEYQRNIRITHARPQLKRALFILWATFDVLLLGLLLYVVGGYLIAGQFSDRQSVAQIFTDIATRHDESLQRAPVALVATDAIVLDLGEGKADFYAEMENRNENWYATFSYGFETDEGEVTEMLPGFIFPGEVRPFIALNTALDVSADRAEFVVENVAWKRIDGHEIDDVSAWMREHADFELSSSQYGDKIEFEEGSVVRSVFTVVNHSPYNYWTAPFWVILERGGTVVGVHQVSIAGFESGEAREVTVNWFGEVPASAESIRVYPVIDYFDEGVYMDQPGNGTERP